MDGVDAIYWINLDRSKDRRIYMENLLQDEVFKNIPAQRITAVDGEKTKDIVLTRYVMQRQPRCSTVEYACFLSHLETIREFSKTDDKQVALIFEDDITLDFKPHWSKTIREIMNEAPDDWEIIQLSYMTEKDKIPTQDFVPTYGNYFSAAAYLIKNHAAKRWMREIYYNEKYHLDDSARHVADEYTFLKLRTYTYRHPYFIYKANNDTTLYHTGSLPFHEKSRKDIEEVLYTNKCGVYWPLWFLLFIIVVFVCVVVFYPKNIWNIFKKIFKYKK
jgi:GR25 family glycosyltransferase involved in LPS biosynthesis